jgi:hypothetical protein
LYKNKKKEVKKMRENIKNVGLILALVIAGVSLPTSIISVMDKPIIIHETIIENHYYNQTIVVNNTIIETFNNTITINNTEYLPINRTIEYYHFGSVQPNEFFFNATFNITFGDVNLVIFTVSSFLDNTQPRAWAYKNGNILGNSYLDYSGIVGFAWTFGYYEVRFENYNMIQNIDIAIETIEIG